MRADGRAALHHRLIELARHGVRAVGAEQQLGVGHDPAQYLVVRLKAVHRGRHLLAGQLGQAAGVMFLERPGIGLGLRQIRLDAGAVRCGVQIGQVPARQVAVTLRRQGGGAFWDVVGHAGVSFETSG